MEGGHCTHHGDLDETGGTIASCRRAACESLAAGGLRASHVPLPWLDVSLQPRVGVWLLSRWDNAGHPFARASPANVLAAPRPLARGLYPRVSAAPTSPTRNTAVATLPSATLRRCAPVGMAAKRVERWVVPRTGSLAHLRREATEAVEPNPSEVQVAVEAIGLNFADVFACLGLYSATPETPFVPGLEFAGVVSAVGKDAGPGPEGTGFRVGDRVMGVTRFGGYATVVSIGSDYIMHVPEGWTMAQACGYPVQALTAFYGLVNLGSVKKGQTVLVHSAAGGVGILALHILERIGAKVIGTVGRPGKRKVLLERFHEPFLGEHQIIVRDRPGSQFATQLDEALKAVGSEGFDVVFDSLAGPWFWQGFDRLARGGRLVVFGSGSMTPASNLSWNPLAWLRLAWQYVTRPRLDPLEMVPENRAVFGFNLIWMYDQTELLHTSLTDLQRLGLPAPLVGHTFPFSDLPRALEKLRSGTTVGKVVVTTTGGMEEPPMT